MSQPNIESVVEKFDELAKAVMDATMGRYDDCVCGRDLEALVELRHTTEIQPLHDAAWDLDAGSEVLEEIEDAGEVIDEKMEKIDTEPPTALTSEEMGDMYDAASLLREYAISVRDDDL